MTDSPQPPDTQGWISVADAADRLGRKVGYVATGHTTGRFPVVRHDGAAWMLEADVDRILEERRADTSSWVTIHEVQRWAGCSKGPIELALARGDITQRPGPRTSHLPSLDRASARAWATTFVADRERRAQARAEHAARTGPPDDEHVWLDTNTAAAIVGVKARNLMRLAQLGRVPATKHGAWWWWRRDLVEAHAAARVAEREAADSDHR